MSTHTPPPTSASPEIEYPDCDGEPMADNNLQYKWISIIKGGLDALYREDPDVFVAGDMLWYPIEGDNKTRIAPDAMVAIGRPKGYRGSYMQWVEDDIAPQVIFEVLSPSNHTPEMARKRAFYEQHGVEEYYVYDPGPGRVALWGWLRAGASFRPIEAMAGWVSPLLGVRFDLGDELELYHPDGRPFLDYAELDRRRAEAEREAQHERRNAEQARRHAEEATRHAEEATRHAEESSRRAEEARRHGEQERARADEERARSAKLMAKLRELGVEPDDLGL